jgi:DNA (cytosine-5)-methyltransferase 1
MALQFFAKHKQGSDFTFVDLFAGIGGLRMAFEEHGGECIFTSEWDEYCQKTYLANFRVRGASATGGMPIRGMALRGTGQFT